MSSGSEQNALKAYQKVLVDTPEASVARLLEVYDLAIQAAEQANPDGVRYCLELLQGALDPTQSTALVAQLHLFYAECHLAVDAGRFDWISEHLQELKRLWSARLAYQT